MPLFEAFRLAVAAVSTAKLRSFFTVLGIVVSVGFLVAVVAIIQGMNAYVKENITGAMIGTNAFQVRRTPIVVGFMDDEQIREISTRPRITREDAEAVRAAFPDARAVALQSGWPTPSTTLVHRNTSLGNVLVFGITPDYLTVQDYTMALGSPLTEPDVRERRPIAVVGWDIASKLFDEPEQALGKQVRIAGQEMTITGVIASKGQVLGQSFDGFVLLPISTFESLYGRRGTTTVSVKMPEGADLDQAMARAEEAMRLAHQLRPGEPNDFSVDKADALAAFWTSLTRVLFTVIPAVVCIGVVVGGIVIMNIMLMSVTERTHEIGIRKSLGARNRDIRRQFMVEAVLLATLGGFLGILGGWGLATLLASVTPLPARVTLWSIGVALTLGAGTGIIFGVYPAARAARLDPITALRAE